MSADEIETGQLGRQQLAERALGRATKRRETAERDVRRGDLSTCSPTGSSPLA